MILSCNHIGKSFDGTTILSDCSFHLNDHEKAAVIGVNGAGKSTLFKIITGTLTPDSGEVVISHGKTVAYLAQHPEFHGTSTIYEEMLAVKKDVIDMETSMRELEQNMKHAAGKELESMLASYSRLSHAFELQNGFAYQSEITGVLKGLGFTEEEFQKPIQTLSGGQKTRVFLSRLLLSNPDLILLDEPTNHLDLNSISWLETFLSNYRGAVLIISHDRYFLDKIVTKVIELAHTHCTTFLGTYSDYVVKKEQLQEALQKQFENQQREIKHQEAVIEKLRSFNREKSIKRAESRVKQLDKIERLQQPEADNAGMRLTLTPQILSGNDILTAAQLSKSFGSRHLFSDVSFEVKRGEKVAIIGNNGTGKTTILKIINGLIESDSGSLTLGHNVEIGYYDQEHQVLHQEKTLFEELSDTYPEMTNTQIRNVLAAFLFTGEDVFKQIQELSGGERGRMSLAKLMLSKANFLILDEPTNHLDLMSKEILERAICNYEGTVLYVSHDRYFINKTATRILDLTNQKLVNYLGNYDYYLEKREALTEIYAPPGQEQTETPKDPSAKADWKTQKEAQARIRKLQNDFQKTEDAIFQAEAELSELNEQLNNPAIASNSHELMNITKQQEALNQTLETLYAQWERLSEELEHAT